LYAELESDYYQQMSHYFLVSKANLETWNSVAKEYPCAVFVAQNGAVVDKEKTLSFIINDFLNLIDSTKVS
jgi:hypothetical protein